MKYKLRSNNYDFKLNINKKCANYLVICTFFIYKEDLQLGTKLEGIIRNIKEEQNRCFIGFCRGFYLLANIPVDQKISDGQKVICKITKVELDGYGLRGKIIKIV